MSRARPPSRGLLAALTALVALGVGQGARAVTISFDPDGPTGANVPRSILGLDYVPGSAVALDAVEGGLFVGEMFTNVFQSRLGAVTVSPGGNATITNLNTTGPGGFEVTIVARFREMVTDFGSNATSQRAEFRTVADPGNFLTIYYDNFTSGIPSNDLTGTGFSDGLPILTAFIGDGAEGESNFRAFFPSVARPIRDLDQTDGNTGPPAQQTLQGTGAFVLTGQVLSYNPGFFMSLDLTKIIVTTTDNGNLDTPFTTARPSPLVAGSPVVLGPVNGLDDLGTPGQDFEFQADVNQSFEVAAVPEPGTMVLAFTGLVTVSLGSLRKLRRRSGSPAA